VSGVFYDKVRSTVGSQRAIRIQLRANTIMEAVVNMAYDSDRYSYSSEWLRIETGGDETRLRMKVVLQLLFGVAED